jgi:hypothetical protein
MKKHLIKKGLALAIILLFICVSFQPVFAVEPSEKVTADDEKIEYTIQIIKINKIIENKVYLTQQQAHELENLIDNIRADLNNSESKEESYEIYNNVVNSFNNLGLFPENITIDEIKQLVCGETQNLHSFKFREDTREGFENRFCLVSGQTSVTFFLSLFLNIASLIKGYLLIFIFRLCWIFNIRILSIGYLGNTWVWINKKYVEYYPAHGWIFTIGTTGVKYYSGYFYGHLFDVHRGYGRTYYPGISGFTGITIRGKNILGVYYLGYALKVAITTSV